MTLNGILMRISNTPPSLLVCRILTNNVEVGTYGCKFLGKGSLMIPREEDVGTWKLA